jgi:hypothetical protein
MSKVKKTHPIKKVFEMRVTLKQNLQIVINFIYPFHTF